MTRIFYKKQNFSYSGQQYPLLIWVYVLCKKMLTAYKNSYILFNLFFFKTINKFNYRINSKNISKCFLEPPKNI